MRYRRPHGQGAAKQAAVPSNGLSHQQPYSIMSLTTAISLPLFLLYESTMAMAQRNQRCDLPLRSGGLGQVRSWVPPGTSSLRKGGVA